MEDGGCEGCLGKMWKRRAEGVGGRKAMGRGDVAKDDGSYVLSDSLWPIKSYTTTQTAQLCFLPISVVDYSKFHRS